MLLVPTDENKSQKEDAELTFGKPTIGRAGFQGSSFAHVSDLNVREFRSLPLSLWLGTVQRTATNKWRLTLLDRQSSPVSSAQRSQDWSKKSRSWRLMPGKRVIKRTVIHICHICGVVDNRATRRMISPVENLLSAGVRAAFPLKALACCLVRFHRSRLFRSIHERHSYSNRISRSLLQALRQADTAVSIVAQKRGSVKECRIGSGIEFKSLPR